VYTIQHNRRLFHDRQHHHDDSGSARCERKTRPDRKRHAAEQIAYVDRELEIIDGIKRGMADAAAGRVIPHAQAVAEMREVIEEAKRRKAARG
jgi:predicted transcriptional regulator